MNKDLKRINAIWNFASAITKIVYVCLIIGASGCLIGAFMLPAIGDIEIEEGKTILMEIETSSNMVYGAIISACFVGLASCISSMFVCQYAIKYFKLEKKEGTPFTTTGANKLIDLGIKSIWIPFAGMIIGSIVEVIILNFYKVDINTTLSYTSFESSLGTGLLIMLIGLLCRYGASLKNNEGGTNE